jgi:hypothetical protein
MLATWGRVAAASDAGRVERAVIELPLKRGYYVASDTPWYS